MRCAVTWPNGEIRQPYRTAHVEDCKNDGSVEQPRQTCASQDLNSDNLLFPSSFLPSSDYFAC